MSRWRHGRAGRWPEALTGRLRAAHVIAGLDPVYGGPSYSVPRLCEALAAAGADTMLLSVAVDDGDQRDVYGKGYRDCRFAWDYARIPILRRLRSSQGLSEALHDAALTADVIHNHGLWLMPNVSAAKGGGQWANALCHLAARHAGPSGPRFFSRSETSAFWALLQGSAIRGAACIHATCEQECEEIREFGLANPVVIIPNGIDVPELPARPTAQPAAERVVLSLGRIHPKKGLARLVRAWSKVEAGCPGWRLKIVGSPEVGHDEQLRALTMELGLTRVSIEGPDLRRCKNHRVPGR